MRPVLVGATAALAVGFVLDIGPWSALGARVLGQADAQEAPQPAPTNGQAEPSEADKAALRYFAREGAVERLEAELRRLRALYPNWTPPRDLLDPKGEDQELQRIYDLVGEQRYAEAREAIAERRQRDPAWSPPERLVDLLGQAEARAEIRRASEAGLWQELLAIAEQNESVLTCEDVDSLWRVAQAFAETGRPDRAFDAYAYILDNCAETAVRAASLQKAAEVLDPGAVTRLFERGAVDASGRNEFESAWVGIVRGAVARGGGLDGQPVPPEWLRLLADTARTGETPQDSMLIGYYLLRQGSPAEAAQWFRFALDNGAGADAAYGYVLALRGTGDGQDEFLAREVAYQWREQTPELMEAYLDAMATLLTADDIGELVMLDVDQDSVNRFVPVVVQQRDANGAQALGWYAFNTCQFIIAEEWFISSANWVPTEASLYGLALTRLRLGDIEGFEEVVDEWGPIYSSVRALASGQPLEPEAPVTGDPDDPTDELGVSSVICDPEERQRLRERMVERERQRNRAVSFTEAGSMPLPPGRSARPEIPRRSVVIEPRAADGRSPFVPAQATVPTPGRQEAVPAPVADEPAALPEPVPLPPGSHRRRPTGPEGATGGLGGPPERDEAVRRRVRQALPTAEEAGLPPVEEPRRQIASAPAGGASAAQRALSAGNYRRCVAITDEGIRGGHLSAADANARGFCLLQLERPVEAAQAFQLARVRARSRSDPRLDAVYGATLAAIASNLTSEAAIEATRAPLSRPRRTEAQIAILTQRAIAANRDGRYVEALHYLDQRARIAPLQKDLMILKAFAYRNAGDFESADRIFRAVNAAGPTPASRRALAVANERALVPQVRSTAGVR